MRLLGVLDISQALRYSDAVINKKETRMVSKAAQELGKKGGQAKSEAKTAAARANAKKPRKPKPMPEMGTKQLMHLAWLELKTERDRCAITGERYDGLKLNGHDLIDVLWAHLQAME